MRVSVLALVIVSLGSLAVAGPAAAQQSKDQYFQEQQQRQQQAFNAEQARQGYEQSQYPQDGNGQPAPDQAVYQARPGWGAIAMNSVRGFIGTSVTLHDPDQAKAQALEKCRKFGNGSCEVALVYANSCAAVVAGDRAYSVENAATPDEARQLGMDKCAARNDTHCEVWYSGCSQAK